MGLSERRNLLLKEQLLYFPPFEGISAVQSCPEGNPSQRGKDISILHPPHSFYAPPKPASSCTLMVALLPAGEGKAIPSTADVGSTSQMSPGPGSRFGLVIRKQLIPKRNIGTGHWIILRNVMQQLWDKSWKKEGKKR